MNLESKFEDDGLVEINGILWCYEQGDDPSSIVGGDRIILNNEVNLKDIEKNTVLQLYRSLDNKHSLIAKSVFDMSYASNLRSGQLIRLYTTNEKR